jgi:uncharacterized protein (TIGR03435 family)
MSRFRGFRGFKLFKGFTMGLALFLSVASAQPPAAPPPTPGPHLRAGGALRMSGARLRDVAFSLSRMLDRPVVDQTGLSGAYSVELKWDANAGSVDRAAAYGVSLFTALPEQLGLALDSRKGPVEFLVIDSADRPVED